MNDAGPRHLRIDHIAISCSDLAEGAEVVEAAVGVPLAPGGRHALMGTHNRLLGLGDTYLEVIAIDPDAPAPPVPRWFDLDRFSGPPRLTNWIVATDDLDAALHDAPEGSGAPVSVARGDLSWRMAVPGDGRLPFDGAYPALIQWNGPHHPTQRLPDSGLRLRALEIAHPDADALRRALKGMADPRVTIVRSAVKAMRATFATPSGPRSIEG